MIVDMWYTLELTNTMYTPIAANHMIEMEMTKQQTNRCGLFISNYGTNLWIF